MTTDTRDLTEMSRRVYNVLLDCPQDVTELAIGARLSLGEVRNGLRELLRDEKVVSFTDNGVLFYRVIA